LPRTELFAPPFHASRKTRSQAVLRESEEWLRLAIQAGRMYAYEWDATADVLVRSPEYVNVLGAAEPRILSHQQALEKIHPDDRPKLVAAVARHSRENPTVDVTYRVLRPGKSPVWVRSSGRAFFDEEGRMLRVVGIVADIFQGWGGFSWAIPPCHHSAHAAASEITK
jgi:PAS domain S-box-containing protein